MWSLSEGYLALKSSRAEGLRRVAIAMSPLSRTVLVIDRPMPEDAPVTRYGLRQFYRMTRYDEQSSLNQIRGDAMVPRFVGAKVSQLVDESGRGSLNHVPFCVSILIPGEKTKERASGEPVTGEGSNSNNASESLARYRSKKDGLYTSLSLGD